MYRSFFCNSMRALPKIGVSEHFFAALLRFGLLSPENMAI